MTTARGSPSGRRLTTDHIVSAGNFSGATLTDVIRSMSQGQRHVSDFGAVSLPKGSDRDQPAVALRTANVKALQAAFDWVLTSGGATLLIGPGIYLTNGAVGYSLSIDVNVGLVLKGLGAFTLIQSNNYNEPALRFHTSGGNIRALLVEDLTIRGGREGLSLVWAAYNRFNRVWFWGSKNFGLQDEAGNGNYYDDCRFDESAQGIGNGTEADACLFVSCENTLSRCNLGEYAGGVIFNGGVSTIEGGTLFHDCVYRGRDYFSYLLGKTVSISATFLPLKASVILWDGSAVLNGLHGNFNHRFLTCFRAYDVIVAGSRLQTLTTPTPFVSFIEVVTAGGVELALNVQSSTFVWLGSNSGAFVKDDGSLHDALIQAQLEVYPGSTVTPLSSSAPALLNPSGQNNLVMLSTFRR